MHQLDTKNKIKIIINRFKNNDFDFVIEKSNLLLKELIDDSQKFNQVMSLRVNRSSCILHDSITKNNMHSA